MELNNGLYEYIKRQKSKGVSDDVIKRTLLASGWPLNIVKKAFCKYNKNLLLKRLIVSVLFIVLIPILYVAKTTGAVVSQPAQFQFESVVLLPVEEKTETIIRHIEFKKAKPLFCEDGIFVEYNGKAIPFEIIKEVYKDGVCVEADIKIDLSALKPKGQANLNHPSFNLTDNAQNITNMSLNNVTVQNNTQNITQSNITSNNVTASNNITKNKTENNTTLITPQDAEILTGFAISPKEQIKIYYGSQDAVPLAKIGEGVQRAYKSDPAPQLIVYQQGKISSKKITKQELRMLAKKVDAIERDINLRLTLKDSAPIIRANMTWARKLHGSNITGAGYSICQIDTGVDYTHPDLGGCFGPGCKIIAGYDFVNSDDDPMDDHGHGTHVAGILAANGNLSGIAPDAKIVALKALDASGQGSLSNLESAIQWCIDNASKYNITVISMSLGAENYSSYCDGDWPILTSLINEAVSKNISVVAATGNDGYPTQVSLPACIYNVTRAAATDKSDVLASYSNRGNFAYILLAPGSNINSTYTNKGYSVLSGTSMSTPHVSAAVVLLRQFIFLQDQSTPTPEYIRELLNKSGKLIFDSQSGKYYPRIDIESAIEKVDHTPPSKPANITSQIAGNEIFITWQITEIDVNKTELWLDNTSRANVSAPQRNYTFSNVTTGQHVIKLRQIDLSGNVGPFSEINVYVGGIHIDSPIEGEYYNTSNVHFNITSDSNITIYSANFSIDNGPNISMTNDSAQHFYNISTTVQEGSHTVVFYVSSSIGFYKLSCNFVVDLTPPEVNLTYPLPGGTISHGEIIVLNITDNFNVSNATFSAIQKEPGAPFYYITGQLNRNQTSWYINTDTWKRGMIDLSVNATDLARNKANKTFLIYVNNSAPNISQVQISPTNPHTTDNLTCVYNFTDFDSDQDLSIIKWFVNGTQVSQGKNLSSNKTVKGARINCTVTAYDGIDYGNTISTGVTILNSYPTIQITYPQNNQVFDLGSHLQINLSVFDADGLSDIDYVKVYYSSNSSDPYANLLCQPYQNYTCCWNTSNITEGNYYITAQVSDGEGIDEHQILISFAGQNETETSGNEGAGSGGGAGIAGWYTHKFVTVSNTQKLWWNTNADLYYFELLPNETSQNRTIKFREISSLPVNEPGGFVYKYFEIVTDFNASGKIKFRVQKSWINDNNIDEKTISLFRYCNGWTKLDTNYISSDSDYAYYESNVPGFSYFAIVGEKKVIFKTSNEAEKQQQQETNTQKPAEAPKTEEHQPEIKTPITGLTTTTYLGVPLAGWIGVILALFIAAILVVTPKPAGKPKRRPKIQRKKTEINFKQLPPPDFGF